MSNTNTKRSGSGRTKGSFSFVKVSVADLCSKFADTKTPVIVSRKWAEAVGFTGLVANPAADTMESIQGQTPTTAVQATVIDLDAPVVANPSAMSQTVTPVAPSPVEAAPSEPVVTA